MRIGFCGAHRVGKTTLAKRVAEEMGLAFIDGSCSGLFERLGMIPSQPLNFKDRLMVQTEILDRYLEKMSGQQNFVTDRTPFDYIGYTLAELNALAVMGENQPAIEAAVEGYLTACKSALNTTLDLAFFVSPGIPLVAAEGKGAHSKPYIQHVSYVIEAYTHDINAHRFGGTMYVPASYIDLDVRTKFCVDSLNLIRESALAGDDDIVH